MVHSLNISCVTDMTKLLRGSSLDLLQKIVLNIKVVSDNRIESTMLYKNIKLLVIVHMDFVQWRMLVIVHIDFVQ